MLLEAGADPNAHVDRLEGHTPLLYATRQGSVEIARLLLQAGAKANSPASIYYGRTALQAACSAKNTTMELFEVLFKAGADIHAPAGYNGGLTALQGAAIRGHMRIALRLLELGADVNAAPAPEEGRMALDGAAEHGRLDMVQMLLNAGAKSGKPEGDSFACAIELANKYGHFAIVRLLEDHWNTSLYSQI